MTEEKESFIYNKNAIMLYKDTETRFVNDDEVSADDLTVMCNMLYQLELLTVLLYMLHYYRWPYLLVLVLINQH